MQLTQATVEELEELLRYYHVKLRGAVGQQKRYLVGAYQYQLGLVRALLVIYDALRGRVQLPRA